MNLSIGILGLPNVGKSTLFRALTKKPVDISAYPFCTIEPNVGLVEVPDQRLWKLAEIQQPEKLVPAAIKFIDVAGLVRGAHKGDGLGNQFLAHLRDAHVLLHVVRVFRADNVSHINGRLNPQEDMEIIESELILKDLETVEKRFEKIADEAKRGKKEAVAEFGALVSLKEKLSRGEMAFLFQKNEFIEKLFLLTAKPQIYLLNGQPEEVPDELKNYLEERKKIWFLLDLREELDKIEIGEKEREEMGLTEPKIPALIKKCYEVLNLITFFTIKGQEETRAWPLEKGKTVFDGAGLIHSDFQKKFVRAEVLNWQKVVEVGSWKKCRELGLLKSVGKDYVLQDGDVVEIKI